MPSQINNAVERQLIDVDNINIPVYRSFLNCPGNDFLDESDSDDPLSPPRNQRDVDDDEDDEINFESLPSRCNFNLRDDANVEISQDQRIDSPSSKSSSSSETTEEQDGQFATDASKLDPMHLFNSKENLQDKIKVLMAMGIGLRNFFSVDNERIKNICASKYSKLKATSFRCSAPEMKVEVSRRVEIYGAGEKGWTKRNGQRVPRPNNWKNMHLKEYLSTNPITDKDDVDDLFMAVETILNAEEDGIKQSDANSNLPTMSVSNLRDFRLIECYLDEELREDFLNRNNCLTRSQIDARNSSSQPMLTYWQKVANKFNDFNFIA